ncbi:MAG: lysine 6-monooxygenase [Cyanobacteria bacterium RYN_339]|nr:lysine 6-monooxygenase [Cyanobacteria bacterium RYN_339]
MKLGILGAGPKALAIAAKAHVLKQLGFAVPELVVFEKDGVAANWRPSSGLTSGHLPLGTPPDKDVGYPYASFLWGDAVNRRINAEMQAFSWQSHMIATREYGEWVDRGRPAPSHLQWAAYLEWVARKVELPVVAAEVTQLELEDGRWRVTTSAGEHHVDGLVVTGPGDVRSPANLPVHPRVRTVADFWLDFAWNPRIEGRSAGVVGAGETAATIAAALAAANPGLAVEIISPQAMAFSRGESYAENHVYTDPFQANWLQLTREDRRHFVSRTDRGVFSVAIKQELDRLRNVEIVPGLFTGVAIDALDQVVAHIAYAADRETRIYDYLVVSMGFDHTGFVARLLGERARAALTGHLGAWTQETAEDAIDQWLAVKGFRPRLHLPMLAGLNQGPGFPNLSCLGRLSDHVLAGYVPIASVTHLPQPFFAEHDL